MGCSIHDIANIYIGLWIQTAFYFGTACLVYFKNIPGSIQMGKGQTRPSTRYGTYFEVINIFKCC